MIWTPVGLVFHNLGNLSFYCRWNIQAANFCLVPYLEYFGNGWVILKQDEIYLRTAFILSKDFDKIFQGFFHVEYMKIIKLASYNSSKPLIMKRSFASLF